MTTAIPTRAGALVLFLLALAASPCRAQTPPDVVILRDGTMFRGTLVERGAQRVILLLPTGETREFAGADVESAGPDVPPPPPVVTPQALESVPVLAPPPSVRLHVQSPSAGRTLHRVIASTEVPLRDQVHRPRLDTMEPICAAPCDLDLPAGTYQFGVSEGTGNAHRAGIPVHLDAGERWVEIDHIDNTGTRIAGWLIVIAGGGAGTALAVAGVLSDDGVDEPGGWADHGGGLGDPGWLGWDHGVWLGIGLGVAAVFAAIGAWMGITDDEGRIRIDTAPPTVAPPPEEPEREEPVRPEPRRPRSVEPDAY
ncbi:hypothetical protein [Sandaracinus amylolyticus]|uniref:Uncharacterized protein n=1 Tax=Sandaracinus amylolyticus TaxID=927083 RepID=A0A0F6VZE9_9BACT|nr:hypothetical protein [Sandaracinus amylolyticus]AKF03530.1 hypothetical protein DB32_000679 [Sandaracinus amylolyticus]